eukprot:IDg7570t1
MRSKHPMCFSCNAAIISCQLCQCGSFELSTSYGYHHKKSPSPNWWPQQDESCETAADQER